jgi:Kef-type K+ transport system membrane component KefB
MALVMCVAALAAVICQFLHQPLVVGYLIAGMVVGPNVPGVYANPERVRLVAELVLRCWFFRSVWSSTFAGCCGLRPLRDW